MRKVNPATTKVDQAMVYLDSEVGELVGVSLFAFMYSACGFFTAVKLLMFASFLQLCDAES